MFSIILALLGVAVAALPVVSRAPAGRDRSWQTAVQSINGLNSILSLLPVLTGKTQNIKLLASRIYPASFAIAGVGAGRVLLKLQLGILLWSFDLYRNTVGDLSYPHDEYVNRFAPRLLHIPTGTPERHRTNEIVNHNLAENYMVEAWFRTQGAPTSVRLRQNNYKRVAAGFAGSIAIYICETYLAVQNAADGTATVLVGAQAICISLWLVGVAIVQVKRGQGCRDLDLNQLNSIQYRCLALPMAGDNVASEVFSFHLSHLNSYSLYDAKYSQPLLTVAGALVLASGVLDILSTVLIVGLSNWAFPWIGLQVVVILAKVVCCVEPTREIEIESPQVSSQPGAARLPLKISLAAPLVCQSVRTDCNVFSVSGTAAEWQSTSAGLWIGQEYHARGPGGAAGAGAAAGKVPEPSRYLAYMAGAESGGGGRLGLVPVPPALESNQALQREFLTALATLVEGNKIPSTEFIGAVHRTLSGSQASMTQDWFDFGAKAVHRSLHVAHRALYWRKLL